jgi:hypothetical protein
VRAGGQGRPEILEGKRAAGVFGERQGFSISRPSTRSVTRPSARRRERAASCSTIALSASTVDWVAPNASALHCVASHCIARSTWAVWAGSASQASTPKAVVSTSWDWPPVLVMLVAAPGSEPSGACAASSF